MNDDLFPLVAANILLAVADLLMVTWLIVSLRTRFAIARKRAAGELDGAVQLHARVHAKAGSAALALYALLGFVSATASLSGPLAMDITGDGPLLFILGTIAVGLRVGIFMVLGAWVAWALEIHVVRRWPDVGAKLDGWLRWRLPSKET